MTREGHGGNEDTNERTREICSYGGGLSEKCIPRIDLVVVPTMIIIDIPLSLVRALFFCVGGVGAPTTSPLEVGVRPPCPLHVDGTKTRRWSGAKVGVGMLMGRGTT